MHLRLVSSAALATLAMLGSSCTGARPGTPAWAGTRSTDPRRVAVDTQRLRRHVVELASDAYRGRAPGTAGEELTVSYLERELREMGLEPGNTDGTFVQRVPMRGERLVASLSIRDGDR